MKPFYSVEELQKIWKQTFAEDIELWTIASAFGADGISAIYQGQPADLAQWYQLTPIHIPGESEPFVEAEYPWPEPTDVLIFSASLPQLWKDCISRYASREHMEIPSPSEKKKETERNRLLKQIGGLALLLAEKVSRYSQAVRRHRGLSVTQVPAARWHGRTVLPMTGLSRMVGARQLEGICRRAPRFRQHGHLLEPLQAIFGRLAIRSVYRPPEVNGYGNAHFQNCTSNEFDRARHIWGRRRADRDMAAMTTVVVPWLVDRLGKDGVNWQSMAWRIHDHLPYSKLQFFPKLGAFNIGWHEIAKRRISSYAQPQGLLTKPSMPNHEGDHSDQYLGLPMLLFASCNHIVAPL